MKTPFLICPVIVLLTVSCSGPFCSPENRNKGIIEDNVNELEKTCFTPASKELFIRNESEYDSLITIRSTDNCKTLSRPAIDFSQHSLLGLHATAGGCEIGFTREAERDDAAKKIKYTVTARGCGTCKKLALSNNFVLIPAVPADYRAEFKVIEK